MGQVEGGTAQGLGLALMEEIQTRDGKITNASFTDYLIPTVARHAADGDGARRRRRSPTRRTASKGIGEPPTVVATAAVASALRSATGRPLARVPVRP